MAKTSLIVCTQCKQAKPIEAFRADPTVKRGHDCACRECRNSARKRRVAITPKLACSVDGCSRSCMTGISMCSMHYARLRKTGSTGPAESTRDSREGLCKIDGCAKSVYCKKRCAAHYKEWLFELHGKCKIDGCSGPALSKGLCPKHYATSQRHGGDPNGKYVRVTGAGTVCKAPGCRSPVLGNGYCRVHYSRLSRSGDINRGRTEMPEGTRRVYRDGYIVVKASGHHESRLGGKWAVEHRKVMADKLGRKLRPNENVHHINGKRDDNRPENLELWVSSQPSGQRPEDLVKWARELLALYGAEVERAKA